MKTQFKTLVRKSDGQWMDMQSDGDGTALFEVEYPIPFDNSLEWIRRHYSVDEIDTTLYDLIKVQVFPVTEGRSKEEILKIAFNWYCNQYPYANTDYQSWALMNKIRAEKAVEFMEEYRQQPDHICKVDESCGQFNPFSKIKFGVWLTGHDEATIKQMYDDFCNSGKDVFKLLTQMPQYNRVKTSVDTEMQLRADADWQELLTLRSENATLKEMVKKMPIAERKSMGCDICGDKICKGHNSIKQPGGVCEWRYDEKNDCYHTCSHDLSIYNNPDDPEKDFTDMGYKYCPYCAELIEIHIKS